MKKYLLISFICFFFLDFAWSGGGDHKDGCMSKKCIPRQRAHAHGFCIECLNNLLHPNKNNSDTGGRPLNTDRVLAEDQNPSLRECQPVESNVPEEDNFRGDRANILNSMGRFNMRGVKKIDYDLLQEKGFQQVVFDIKKLKDENNGCHGGKYKVEVVLAHLAIHDPARLVECHGSFDRLVDGIPDNITELSEPINAFYIVHHNTTEISFENIGRFSDVLKIQIGTWILLNGFESKNLVIIHRAEDFYIVIHPLVGFYQIPVVVDNSEILIMRALVSFYMDNGGFEKINYFKAKPQTTDDNSPGTVDDEDEEVAGLTSDIDNNVINFRVPVNPLNATYDELPDLENLDIRRVKGPPNDEKE